MHELTPNQRADLEEVVYYVQLRCSAAKIPPAEQVRLRRQLQLPILENVTPSPPPPMPMQTGSPNPATASPSLPPLLPSLAASPSIDDSDCELELSRESGEEVDPSLRRTASLGASRNSSGSESESATIQQSSPECESRELSFPMVQPQPRRRITAVKLPSPLLNSNNSRTASPSPPPPPEMTNDTPIYERDAAAVAAATADADCDDDECDDDEECESENERVRLVDWSDHLRLGTLPAGHNPSHDPMKLNLATVQYMHRPFALYAGVQFVGAIAATVMRYLNFRHYPVDKSIGRYVSYWYREGTREAGKERPDPIVLIHGIGIGPLTYLHLLKSLYTTKPATKTDSTQHTNRTAAATASASAPSSPVDDMYYPFLPTSEPNSPLSACLPSSTSSSSAPSSSSSSSHNELLYSTERSMYILELPYISMKLGSDDVPSPSEHVSSFVDMLCTHEIATRISDAAADGRALSESECDIDAIQHSANPIKAIVVGHSYGTFVTSWLVRHASSYLSSVFFIDPVNFLVFDPSLM